MPQYIKKIRTRSGDLKIDYEALANLPKLGALAPKNKVGKTDLAKDVLEGYATTEQIDEKIAAVNDAIKNISWNNLTNRPFGEMTTTGPFTITVDWNTFVPKVETISADHWGYVKVSDETPTLDDLINGLVYIKESSTTEMSYNQIVSNYNDTNRNLFFYDAFIVAPTDNCYMDLSGWGDVTCPEKGIYFRQDKITSLIINNYTTTIEKQIDEKYLPTEYKSTINALIGPYSEGLAYTLKDDGTYEVTGIGTCTDTDIIIPSIYNGKRVTSIDGYAFLARRNMTSITIPDSVTNIGDRTFANCDSLQSITIPDGVTSIGEGAFVSCDALTSVIIGNSVTSIGDDAFQSCSNLTNITIGDSVTSIGNSAFYNCTSLKSVTIGDSVTSIGSSAFYGCTNLTIYCEADSPSDGWNINWNSSSRPVVWGAALGFSSINERINNKELYLYSSTEGSTKRFKLTIDDSGTISAVEVSR